MRGAILALDEARVSAVAWAASDGLRSRDHRVKGVRRDANPDSPVADASCRLSLSSW